MASRRARYPPRSSATKSSRRWSSSSGDNGAATAQQLSKLTRIDHSMVRNVLPRAVAAKIADQLPRTGGSRSEQYYQPSPGDLWDATFALACIVVGDIVRVTT